MRPKLGYLRIVWTVGWGVLAVMLVALWVRSYSWTDTLNYATGREVMSVRGKVHPSGVFYAGIPEAGDDSPWIASAPYLVNLAEPEYSFIGFGYTPTKSLPVVVIPDWFLVLVSATLAAVPWIRWSKRFSLRTLLIVMTFIAVVLGMFVYFFRAPSTPPVDVGDFGPSISPSMLR